MDLNIVLQNANIFIKSGGYATWQFILFEHNLRESVNIKKLALSLGFSSIDFIRSWNNRKISRKNIMTKIDNNFTCQWRNKRYYINTDGIVFPCCHIVNKYLEETLLKNGSTIHSIIDKYDCSLFSNENKSFYDLVTKLNSSPFYEEILNVCSKLCKY